MKNILAWICARWRGDAVPIFYAWCGYIQPAPGPTGRRYDLKKDPFLRACLKTKLREGIEQFGSFEAFMAQYEREISQKEEEIKLKIQVLRMRQMQRDWMKANHKQQVPQS